MKISIRTISFGAIIIVCIIAVVMAFYMQFKGVFQGDPKEENPIGITEENKELAKNFDKLFRE